MRLVKFDPRQVNLIEVGSKKFFLLSPDGHATFLVSAICPHRGGPLYFGQLDPSAGVIQCPWHGRQIPVRFLIREALPLVLRRDMAIAILAEPEETPVRLWRRALPTRLPGPCEDAGRKTLSVSLGG